MFYARMSSLAKYFFCVPHLASCLFAQMKVQLCRVKMGVECAPKTPSIAVGTAIVIFLQCISHCHRPF